MRDIAQLVGPAPYRVSTEQRTVVVQRVATYDDRCRLLALYLRYQRLVRGSWTAHPDSTTGYVVQQACITLAPTSTRCSPCHSPVQRRVSLGKLADDALGITSAGGARVILDLDGVQAAHGLIERRGCPRI